MRRGRRSSTRAAFSRTLLPDLSASATRAVLTPKTGALSRLAAVPAAGQPLQSFVFFSSTSALLGSGGQANYSAANLALDAEASRMASCGSVCSSVQWGAWSAGMALSDRSTLARMERLGVGVLSSRDGLAALGGLLSACGSRPGLGGWAAPVSIASSFHWARFMQQQLGAAAPFYALFTRPAAETEANEACGPGAPAVGVEGPSRGSGSRSRAAVAAAGVVAAAPPASQASAVQVGAIVRAAIQAVVGREVGPSEPLLDAGLDSLGAVELRGSLERETGLSLPATLVFDYPSAESLATFLKNELAQTSVSPSAVCEPSGLSGFDRDDASTRSVSFADERLLTTPAASLGSPTFVDIRSFSFLTASSTASSERASGSPGCSFGSFDASSCVPLTRWDTEDCFLRGQRLHELTPRYGAFVPNADLFDAEIFGILASEACLMDPQQRILLHTVSEALSGVTLADSVVGCFLGISASEYGNQISPNSEAAASTHHATGAALSVASGRISFTFGLGGPSVSIDTACSSSLVGTHAARTALLGRECTASLSCGVNLTLALTTALSFARGGMLAPDGRCKTLDASADGYVRGEACGVLFLGAARPDSGPGGVTDHHPTGLLARLPPRQAMGIAGSAVNQDGRSSSLTAPNGPAQQRAIRAALLSAGSLSADVSGVQLHGTGTPLGDPIEIGAVNSVFLSGQGKEAGAFPFSLATVKTAYGHTEPAAGVIGLLSSVFSLTYVPSHLALILGTA